MKKLVTGFLFVCLLVSCGERKTKTNDIEFANEVESIQSSIDSISIDDVDIDSLSEDMDESFDDFMYNFASNQELQLERIHFPLPYTKNNVKSTISEDQWEHDELFTTQNYYTLLFDRENEMDLVGDTSLTKVQIEWIYLKEKAIKKYFFSRNNEIWTLDSLNFDSIKSSKDENFIDFFAQFANDSIFQISRIQNPLLFVTADPDDDFSIIETSLDLNQWLAFKPELPHIKLSNINYGQRMDDSSNKKIIALKGIGNGFSNILYFKRPNKNSSWKLYKFEDVSI